MQHSLPPRDLSGFGERLRAVRVAFGEMTGRLGISQEAFAQHIGIKANTYRRYERAEMEPPFAVLDRLRRLTGVSLCYLICGMKNGFDGMAMRDMRAQITLGDRLCWARETQAPWLEVAARTMGVSALQWQRWEENLDTLPVEKAKEFAHRFSVSLDYLYSGLLIGIPERVLRELLRAHPELGEQTAPPSLALPPAGNDMASDADRNHRSNSGHAHPGWTNPATGE